MVISIAVILASIALGAGVALAGSSFVLFSAVTTPVVTFLGAKWAIIAASVAGSIGVLKLISSIALWRNSNNQAPTVSLSIGHPLSTPAQPSAPVIPSPVVLVQVTKANAQPATLPTVTPSPSQKLAAPTVAPTPSPSQKLAAPTVAPTPSLPPVVAAVPQPRKPKPIPLPPPPLVPKSKEFKNGIVEIPATLFDENDWTHLSFNGNKKLAELPAAIGNFTQLRSLDLSFNQLTSLPEEIEFLTELTYLDVRYNQLSKLPAALSKLTNLETLILDYNSFKYLPNIGNLVKLKKLDLHDNKRLTNLPDCFEQLRSLEDIDLSATEIEELPNSFRHLSSLNSLHICHCYSLKAIPAFTWEMPNFTYLEITQYQERLLPPKGQRGKVFVSVRK